MKILLLLCLLALAGCGHNVPVKVRIYNLKAKAFQAPEMVWIRHSEAALLAPGDTTYLDFMSGGTKDETGGMCLIQQIGE